MVYLTGFTGCFGTRTVPANAKVEANQRYRRKDEHKVYTRNTSGSYCCGTAVLLLYVVRDTRPKGRTMRAHAIAVLVTGAVLSAGCFFVGPAVAQQDASIKPIGKVITAAGSVTIEHVTAVVVQAAIGNQPGQAKIGDPIYLGDVLSTGADGRVGITFTDGTAFDLSSNARMAMTEFIYDPNSQSNSSLMSLTKGTFTFVAGKIAKTGDMKVDTPVATMGIRGTTPRVEISEDGTVKFSSLIEEGKDQILQRGGANRRAAAPAPTIEERRPNLEICRGC
jgi:hypothetical protein